MKIKFTTAFFVLASWVLSVNAQIALAPSFVFIGENSGVGDLFVSNTGDQAYEVTISFAFGYPGGDADGNLVMNYSDPAAFAEFALDSMIRAFPRTFVLPAGEQRTVRIQVLPNQRRKQGFFFTRMKVLAKPQATEVIQEVPEGIGARITFNFEQVTAVFYHKGKASTGIKVKEIVSSQSDTVLHLKSHLQRLGNAPFLGSMTARLTDSNGNTVAQTQSTTTAYFDVIRRFDMNIAGVKPGNYNLEVEFETRRNDMAANDLIQAPNTLHKSEITIK